MAISGSFRENPRLRVGLALIVVISCIYLLLEWRDNLEQSATSVRQISSQVARMQQQEGQVLWADRAVQAERALAGARARLWRDSSTGRAQAQVQDWLANLLRQVDAKGVSVRVAEGDAALEVTAARPSSLPAGLVPVRARVELNSDPLVLMSLLAEMADADPGVLVDRLNVKPAKTEMGLVFWFLIPSSKPTS